MKPNGWNPISPSATKPFVICHNTMYHASLTGQRRLPLYVDDTTPAAEDAPDYDWVANPNMVVIVQGQLEIQEEYCSIKCAIMAMVENM